MRTRKEIEKDVELYCDYPVSDRLKIELLLDIRELLKKRK